MIDKIKFTRNWNNKLNNDYFTTIRLADVKRFYVGKTLEVILNDKHFCYTEIIKTYECFLDDLKDLICYMDTGYNAVTAKAMFRRMYESQNIDFKRKKNQVILLKKIKSEK